MSGKQSTIWRVSAFSVFFNSWYQELIAPVVFKLSMTYLKNISFSITIKLIEFAFIGWLLALVF